jgi:2,3-bisphosphoglycerate-independent phosphoglycerate mutase
VKLSVVILAGAADEAAGSLGGRTPLEAARMPALAALAAAGRCGAVRTLPPGSRPSLEAALGAVFGLKATPPAGGLLAAALGAEVPAGTVPWRGDLVNLFDGRLFDPSAGSLREEEAGLLVETLDRIFAPEGARFRRGVGWRTLLLLPESTREAMAEAPAALVGERVADHGPRGPGADFLRALMERAEGVLTDHDVNVVRADLGENPASGLWIWGGGAVPPVRKLGPGTAFGEHPSFLGLARGAGLDPAPAGLSPAAAGGLAVVFLEGPLRASRAGDPAAKVAALEAADRETIAPLAERSNATGEGRVLVLASHACSCRLRRDLPDAVPFALAGPGTARYGDVPFSESGARKADLVVERAGELLDFALNS